MSGWKKMSLDGYVCSNGKPYQISLKEGTVNKLLVNFFGGGLSWNAETAANPLGIGAMLKKKDYYYISHISAPMFKMMHIGLLDPKDQRNPFRDWYILNIFYTSADFHIGNHDFAYGDQVLHHHGRKNVAAALGILPEFFPQTPDTLMIMGQSAGGFGALAYAPQIQALYPDCKHTVVYSEGSHIHSSLWPEIARDVWKVRPELLAYIKSDDLIVDLFRYARDHMPDSTLFLHSNTLWDKMLVEMMYKMNHGKKIVNAEALKAFHHTLISAVRTLKREIPHYTYFLTEYEKNPKDGTTAHTFAGTPKFLYGEIQDSMSVANWLCRGIAGEPTDIGTKFLKEEER